MGWHMTVEKLLKIEIPKRVQYMRVIVMLTPPPSGKIFYGRDRAAMAEALGVTGAVSPYTVYATTSANPELTGLRPVAPPAAFSNNHLGYALTWFGLAIVLVVFYAALLLRRYRPMPAKDR
jgi:surfeit locus 1 family protein